MVKNPPANAGDSGSIPWLGRSPGGGNGNPLQYFWLENSMDGGAWWTTVQGVTKNRTQLNNSTHAHRNGEQSMGMGLYLVQFSEPPLT